MWDPVPWFVAGGKHSPEVARLVAYLAGGGSEGGVVDATACKVQELAVPGVAVQVMPGPIVVPNRQPGSTYESYAARNPVAEVVPMTAVGSGGERTDLIIARIEDPEMPGIADDPDGDGPYVFSRVIEGVPATTRRVQEIAGHENDSAVTLARVTRPASTGTVQNAHITDLRELAQPRSKHEVRIDNPVADDLLNETLAVGEHWPSSPWTVNVPPWATRVRIIATWAQVQAPVGATQGWLWAILGDGSATPAPTQKVRWDNTNAAGTRRETYVCADDIAVPAELRGKTVDLRLRAYKSGGNDAGRLILDTGSAVSCTLDFLETAS